MEMKENNQKKVLLSVLGVAILVVAVVGISFAIYSTSFETGANSISTGTVTVRPAISVISRVVGLLGVSLSPGVCSPAALCWGSFDGFSVCAQPTNRKTIIRAT